MKKWNYFLSTFKVKEDFNSLFIKIYQNDLINLDQNTFLRLFIMSLCCESYDN